MARHWTIAAFLVVLASSTTAAHFVFVVPDGGGKTARVLLSETLEPDAQVPIDLIAKAQLVLRETGDRETQLTLAKAEHAFVVNLSPGVRGVVHGVVDLGVMTRGSDPHVLMYYSKTILGDAFDRKTRLGSRVPVEIVPAGDPGNLRLQLLVRNQPHADAEITVLIPDGQQKIVKTDREGFTEPFAQTGRYGAWARYWERVPGEREGQKYSELRHYATLVFDVAPPARAESPSPEVTATSIAKLPEPTSSFGAAAIGEWLYVYGGHVAPTHVYSTDAVSGHFNRLNLSSGKWESLPSGPQVQGMNLAAYAGRIYRVGGMEPRNKPGDPADNHSLADVASFDPAARRWEALPPLPTPRSSHDIAVVGSRLFVIGGWDMRGKGEPILWSDTIDVIDLASPASGWKSLPQPFKRRAYIAATDGRRIYVIGGFDEQSKVVRGMDIYDVERGTWTSGPPLPGGSLNGFGPAATTLDGRLYVSIDDGSLHRLAADASSWEPVGRASPRIVHRLVPDGRQILILGGARKNANLDLVEAIRVDR